MCAQLIVLVSVVWMLWKAAKDKKKKIGSDWQGDNRVSN